MEEARDARIVLVERESVDLLFGEGIFRGRRTPLPDLIVVDTALAGVAPAAIIARVRNDWWLHRVPVLLLCAHVAEGERFMCGRDRPNAYLVKPVTRAAFAEIVRQVRNWSLRLDLPEEAPWYAVRWPDLFSPLPVGTLR
jgi:CheY-like chemotaxis protein